jgi:hypothetical protein
MATRAPTAKPSTTLRHPPGACARRRPHRFAHPAPGRGERIAPAGQRLARGAHRPSGGRRGDARPAHHRRRALPQPQRGSHQPQRADRRHQGEPAALHQRQRVLTRPAGRAPRSGRGGRTLSGGSPPAPSYFRTFVLSHSPTLATNPGARSAPRADLYLQHATRGFEPAPACTTV